jgi:hypothetical protein
MTTFTNTTTNTTTANNNSSTFESFQNCGGTCKPTMQNVLYGFPPSMVPSQCAQPDAPKTQCQQQCDAMCSKSEVAGCFDACVKQCAANAKVVPK